MFSCSHYWQGNTHFLTEVSLKACNFIKKRLKHRCFPVVIAKYFLHQHLFYTKFQKHYQRYRSFPNECYRKLASRYYSSVRILFSMIKKHHTLRIVYTQGWSNSFLGARPFGRVILLGWSKNGLSKSKCTSNRDRTRNVVFSFIA